MSFWVSTYILDVKYIARSSQSSDDLGNQMAYSIRPTINPAAQRLADHQLWRWTQVSLWYESAAEIINKYYVVKNNWYIRLLLILLPVLFHNSHTIYLVLRI